MIKFFSYSLRRNHSMIRRGKNGTLESTSNKVVVSDGDDCGFAILWNSFINSESAADNFFTEIIEVESQIRSSNRGPVQVYRKEFAKELQSSLTQHAILRAVDSVWKHPRALGSIRVLMSAFTNVDMRDATPQVKNSIDQVIMRMIFITVQPGFYHTLHYKCTNSKYTNSKYLLPSSSQPRGI
jgi:hypothetical protein